MQTAFDKKKADIEAMESTQEENEEEEVSIHEIARLRKSGKKPPIS